MNRSDLQQLAETRLSDARALLATGVNDAGAYYMAGYAVECALKAVIAKNQGEHPFPPRLSDKDLSQKYYTHDLVVLVSTAELNTPFGLARAANPTLEDYWIVVRRWNETLRYTVQVPRLQSEELVLAIGDRTNGVLEWLRKYW